MSKENTICYDVNLIPNGLSFAELLDIQESAGLLFYDSGNFKNMRVRPEKDHPFCLENGELPDFMINVETMVIDDVIEKYKEHLTESQIDQIKNFKK